MNLKTKLLTLALAAGFAGGASGQLIITGFVDADITGTPRVVEFFVNQTFESGDLSDWSLRASTDGFAANDSSVVTTNFDTLTGTAGDFIYFQGAAGDLNSITGGVLTDANAAVTSSTLGSTTGTRDLILRDGSDTIVDAYDRVNGSGADFALFRSVDGSGPDGSTFVAASWTEFDTNGLSDAAIISEVNANFGTYAVPEPEFYGALAGILALGIAVARRRKRS
jgi:hypothetical protein